CMPYCAIWFADDQIREQASLTGNLVNASPAADGTPPVVALNGEIELARLSGGEIHRRTVRVEEFIEGPGRTKLQPDEIATAVILDAVNGYGGSFQKVGQRRSLVISVACCAALVKTDITGTIFEDVRLALGGVGPRPIRLNDIENALRGERVSRELINSVAQLAAGVVASRSRKEYRRDVVVGFVKAAIEEALTDQPDVVVQFQDTRETVNG
ncbi:MAG: xanthine dehydrogenase family protein subunit M, partial [Halocynthiibacter sp.]